MEEPGRDGGQAAGAAVAACANAVISGAKAYKKLRAALLRIEGSIRHDIKVRLEIAFLPYKASMWDSLESVWRAAEEDPDCDAYVVPIPYYDRKGDGTLGAYHYEGKDFPADVPIVYFENYRLEDRRPDIVYIHNPYDQGNFVTTVDSRFYSGEIKKYADKLVYIPYYTTTGGMAESQARCYGYYNADYIAGSLEGQDGRPEGVLLQHQHQWDAGGYAQIPEEDGVCVPLFSGQGGCGASLETSPLDGEHSFVHADRIVYTIYGFERMVSEGSRWNL